MRLSPPLLMTVNNQPPAMNRQTSVSVGHENLRVVKTLDISIKPGGSPSHNSKPATNLMAGYT